MSIISNSNIIFNNNWPVPILFGPISNPQADPRVAHLRVHYDGNIINGHDIKHMQYVYKTTKIALESL